MKKLALSLALITFLALPLAGCNTMEGLGKDTSAAGHALEDSAQKTKSY
ncbi:MAG: entericidin A/B family lipoprotein [Micavibrio sp.]|nr:entericidin A/B family lipoprotein [Micavibrio sp.]